MLLHTNRFLTADEAGIRPRLMPVGACKQWISDVRVSDYGKDCVAFLGQKNSRGEFVPHGTAFFVGMIAYQRTLPYIVTAKHVLDQMSDDAPVLLRVNTISASGVRYVPLPKAKWHFHPEHNEEPGRKQKYVDVAVYRPDFDYTDVQMVFFTFDDFLTDEKRSEYDVGVGDEIVITGLFFSHIGEARNIPVVRTGNIAAVPDEPLPTDKGLMDGYLVEVRSIGGISGSPVFTHLAVRPDKIIVEADPYPQLEHKTLKKADKVHYLLGLVHGYYTINTQEEWVSKTEQQVGDLNTGITIVIPASKIADTINQPSVSGADIEMARKFDEASKRRSRAKTASVPSASDRQASDENPNAREDFIRLANAAARKQKPDE